MYALPRYDSNRTNKTNHVGPQEEIATKNLVIGQSNTSFTITPLIDKYGNFYVVHPLDVYSYNTSIASYDKNGLFRWKFDMYDYYGQGELILADSIYYLSGDKLIKFSITGEKLWENYFDALGYHNFLFSDNNLYFKCNTLGEIGLCKISLEENAEVELIYSMAEDKEISNLLIDELGNIFVIYDLKLVKIAPDKSFTELAINTEEYARINMLQNKILISSSNKEILVDKDSMSVLLDEIRESNLHNVSIASDGFYIFEVAGPDDAIFLLDISDNTIKDFSYVKRTNMNGYPCVVDANNSIYYLSSESELIGYKRDGNVMTQLFSQNAGSNMGFDIILIEGKIYYPAWDKLVEVSFE